MYANEFKSEREREREKNQIRKQSKTRITSSRYKNNKLYHSSRTRRLSRPGIHPQTTTIELSRPQKKKKIEFIAANGPSARRTYYMLRRRRRRSSNGIKIRAKRGERRAEHRERAFFEPTKSLLYISSSFYIHHADERASERASRDKAICPREFLLYARQTINEPSVYCVAHTSVGRSMKYYTRREMRVF